MAYSISMSLAWAWGMRVIPFFSFGFGSGAGVHACADEAEELGLAFDIAGQGLVAAHGFQARRLKEAIELFIRIGLGVEGVFARGAVLSVLKDPVALGGDGLFFVPLALVQGQIGAVSKRTR